MLLLTYLAAGCTVPHYQSSASLAPQGTPPIPHARVYLVGETASHDLSDVLVLSDSLIGFDESSGARVAFPGASVSSVETQRVSAGRTAGYASLAVLGALAIYLIVRFHDLNLTLK